MRRTTVILLAILSSVLLLSVIFIIHLRFFAPIDKTEKNFLSNDNFSGKVDSINVSLYKVIRFVDENNNEVNDISSSLMVQTFKNEQQKGMFCYPKELSFMINKQVSGDTLVIKLSYSEEHLTDLLDKYKSKRMHANFSLYTNSASTLSIRNESKKMGTILKMITLKEATVYGVNEIVIDSCKIDRLNISGYHAQISLANNKINIFSIDLENLNNWKVDKCDINEEHLTGKGNNYVSLPKTECKKMVWKGKTKDSEINVSLKADKATISF